MLTISTPTLVNETGGLEARDQARLRFEVTNGFPAGSRVDNVNLTFTYRDGFTGPTELALQQPLESGETVRPEIIINTDVQTVGEYEIKVAATFTVATPAPGNGDGSLVVTVVGDGVVTGG